MNGINATGKQNHRCQDCDRQFVLEPLKQPISDEKKALIDRLLLERIPLAGIARSIPVSESWLQAYVNQKYQAIPRELNPPTLFRVRLVIECDEMWSFVAKEHNKLMGLDSERGTSASQVVCDTIFINNLPIFPCSKPIRARFIHESSHDRS
ncbi:hypothetical protein G3480_16825 [Thiorhodococcus mannitoliphagus]|uniref:IS1 family transposase n=1 Tax=Thiorhodococcus mannitoliphagus TaxID=329406 RepID=A0A6P1DW83_9GAMM|nr:hypothetical protein [Thiorhodococcus mannitoliphagus]NEX21949.1 hypothetical protein [Thiorhodococcus mannitoliphagus]